jgi:hypothetical protein
MHEKHESTDSIIDRPRLGDATRETPEIPVHNNANSALDTRRLDAGETVDPREEAAEGRHCSVLAR